MAASKDNRAQVKIPLQQKLSLIILGLLLFFILLEIGLRLAGFIISSLQEYRNQVSLNQKTSYRIMCLGESTTAMGGSYSYPSQLETILNERSGGIKFSVINKGIPATDTSMILLLLEENLNKYNPNMVIAMMGINDQGKHFFKEDTLTSWPFLKSFKIYDLMRYLWFRVITKIQETHYYWTKRNKNTLKIQNSYLKIKTNKYSDQKKYTQDKETFKRIVEEKPKDDKAYIELGKLYTAQERFTLAEKAFKKALEINPRNIRGYVRLGWVYEIQGKNAQKKEIFKKATEVLEKAMKVDISNGRIRDDYVELGIRLEESREYSMAESVFKKVLEIDSGNYAAYLHLGKCYFIQGQYTLAEEMYKKALELNYKNSEAYKTLAILYHQMGKHQIAEENLRKANELSPDYYCPITHNNYLKLKETLDKKKIKLVCVQYPGRSAEPLREIFVDQRNVIIVDNEQVFKETLEKAVYRDYFEDMFADDFGHCTPKGNRLLAENIARVILKEVFKK